MSEDLPAALQVGILTMKFPAGSPVLQNYFFWPCVGGAGDCWQEL